MFLKNSLISFHCDTKSVGTQITAGFPKNFGSHTPLLTAIYELYSSTNGLWQAYNHAAIEEREKEKKSERKKKDKK